MERIMYEYNHPLGEVPDVLKLPLHLRPFMPLGGMDEWSTPKIFRLICILPGYKNTISRIDKRSANESCKLQNPPAGWCCKITAQQPHV